MKTGMKSVIFGVHNAIFHPLTVWLAWIALYKKLPGLWETVAIILHDTPGYWTCAHMDDAEGEQHPLRGARWVRAIVFFFTRDRAKADFYYNFTRYHSRYLAARDGAQPSALAWADKYCVHFDPAWFYLFRARLSGELKEYRANAALDRSFLTDREWYAWLQRKCERDAINRIPASHRKHGLRPDTIIPIFYRRSK